MDKENYYILGYISKAHGQKGDLVLILDVDDPKKYSKLESVFIEINNELIPFFIENIEIQKGNRAHVRFQDINLENSRRLIRKAVYLSVKLLPKLKGNKFYYHEVIDFKITDINYGDIGIIRDVIDIQPQALFQVIFQGKEILIPVVDEIIKKVDRDNKEILVETPEGLIDLYLK